MRAVRFWFGWLAILGVVVGLAISAPLIAPYAPNAAQPLHQFMPPSAAHWLGTDQLGQDVLSRTIWGARNTLAAALLSTFIAFALALFIGGVAGMLGGGVDWALMRVVDVLLAFPGLLMALALVAILKSGLWQAAVAVGISLAPAYSRLVRAAVLAARTRPFVEVARTLGGGPLWILRRHVLPNISTELIAYATVAFAWSMLNMAALDFLGVSGSPSVPTWGRLLGEGRTYLRVAPWIALAPGVMLTLSVLSVMGVSDAWRRLPGSPPSA